MEDAVVVEGGLHPRRLHTAELVDRSPPELTVLGREAYLRAAGQSAPEDAHLRVELAMGTRSVSRLCRLEVGPADERALLCAWLVRKWRGTPANVAPEEHDDMRWFDLADLPPLAHDVVRAALLGQSSA